KHLLRCHRNAARGMKMSEDTPVIVPKNGMTHHAHVWLELWPPPVAVQDEKAQRRLTTGREQRRLIPLHGQAVPQNPRRFAGRTPGANLVSVLMPGIVWVRHQ